MNLMMPRDLPFSHSGTGSAIYTGGLSFGTARAMHNIAAQLGCELPKYLLAPEVTVLLSYLPDQEQRMLFETLWNTGGRLNEVLALHPAHLMLTCTPDQPNPIVVLKTLKQREQEYHRRPGRPPSAAHQPADPRYRKSREATTRIVPLLDADYVVRMHSYLATRSRRGVKHRPVWPYSSRQTPLNWLNEELKRAQKDGITFAIPVTPHTFRHRYAMHLLMSGVPQKVLQGLLGHRYSRSTEFYLRVFTLDVLAARGIRFSVDLKLARTMMSAPE